MTVKEKIIEKVNEIEDSEFLESILNAVELMDSNSDIYTDLSYQNSEEFKSVVEESLNDSKYGKTISTEDSKSFFKEWFKEQSTGL